MIRPLSHAWGTYFSNSTLGRSDGERLARARVRSATMPQRSGFSRPSSMSKRSILFTTKMDLGRRKLSSSASVRNHLEANACEFDQGQKFTTPIITATVLIAMLVDQVHEYVTATENFNTVHIILLTSVVIYFVSVLTLICVPGLRKRHPANVILLFVFTISSSVMISIACTTYQVESVMMALGIAVLCCAGIFIFSFNTKYDLSSRHGLVFCLLWGLLLSCLLIPLPYSSTSNKVRIMIRSSYSR